MNNSVRKQTPAECCVCTASAGTGVTSRHGSQSMLLVLFPESLCSDVCVCVCEDVWVWGVCEDVCVCVCEDVWVWGVCRNSICCEYHRGLILHCYCFILSILFTGLYLSGLNPAPPSFPSPPRDLEPPWLTDGLIRQTARELSLCYLGY